MIREAPASIFCKLPSFINNSIMPTNFINLKLIKLNRNIYFFTL